MQCTFYPTENKDALAALKDIERHFPDFVLGLSDHTLGTIIPAASILGAKVTRSITLLISHCLIVLITGFP